MHIGITKENLLALVVMAFYPQEYITELLVHDVGLSVAWTNTLLADSLDKGKYKDTTFDYGCEYSAYIVAAC
jgi:hypothetical protein